MGLLTKEVDVIDSVVMIVIGAAVGIIAGYFVRKIYLKQKLDKLENFTKEIIDKAHHDSETVQKKNY